ncbi:hypothetical protein CEXT_661811 [Caerostris extrusa]|uniref:Uncharacterized protein n=1 Tax=Caerostris extrusa TaxID=172846 RepID=A0AAV4MNG8_CAEEX|nr:hypothetical protein CEXT_661811 [Caerostris extrusa]
MFRHYCLVMNLVQDQSQRFGDRDDLRNLLTTDCAFLLMSAVLKRNFYSRSSTQIAASRSSSDVNPRPQWKQVEEKYVTNCKRDIVPT